MSNSIINHSCKRASVNVGVPLGLSSSCLAVAFAKGIRFKLKRGRVKIIKTSFAIFLVNIIQDAAVPSLPPPHICHSR